MDCRVVVEAAVPVYDVETADEAVRIAISKTGEMLNPDLNYVEISMGERTCSHCGEGSDPAFIAADEGLVALELEMTVFNVERDEHAARIARKEIGQRLQNIPLEVLEVEAVEDGEPEEEPLEEETPEDVEDGAEADAVEGGESSAHDVAAGSDEVAPSDTAPGGDGTDSTAADQETARAEEATEGDDGGDDDADDILPEFEDLIDEEP